MTSSDPDKELRIKEALEKLRNGATYASVCRDLPVEPASWV